VGEIHLVVGRVAEVSAGSAGVRLWNDHIFFQ
jgi:hypothetical protein